MLRKRGFVDAELVRAFYLWPRVLEPDTLGKAQRSKVLAGPGGGGLSGPTSAELND